MPNRTFLPVLFGVSTSIAGARAADLYQVDFIVARDGHALSKPSAQVEAGKAAELTIENANLPGSAIHLSAAIGAENSAKGAASNEAISMKVKAYYRERGEWVLLSEPSFTVGLDQKVSFETSSANTNRGAANVAVSFTITKPGG